MSAYESDERARRRHQVEAIIGVPLAKNKAEATLQMWNWLGKQGAVAAYQDRGGRGVRISLLSLLSGLEGIDIGIGDTLYLALEQAILKLGPQRQKEEGSELEALLEKVRQAARERYAELGYVPLGYWQVREEADRIADNLTPFDEGLEAIINELKEREAMGLSRYRVDLGLRTKYSIAHQLLYGEALLCLCKSEDEALAGFVMCGASRGP